MSYSGIFHWTYPVRNGMCGRCLRILIRSLVHGNVPLLKLEYKNKNHHFTMFDFSTFNLIHIIFVLTGNNAEISEIFRFSINKSTLKHFKLYSLIKLKSKEKLRNSLAIKLAIVPLGRKIAASFPNNWQLFIKSFLTVGSSPYTSSPTSAATIASLISFVGLLMVSVRKSTTCTDWQSPFNPYPLQYS